MADSEKRAVLSACQDHRRTVQMPVPPNAWLLVAQKSLGQVPNPVLAYSCYSIRHPFDAIASRSGLAYAKIASACASMIAVARVSSTFITSLGLSSTIVILDTDPLFSTIGTQSQQGN